MITPDHIKISVHSLAFGQSIKLNDALKISKYFFKYCPKQNILFYEYTCVINVLQRTTLFVLVYYYTFNVYQNLNMKKEHL